MAVTDNYLLTTSYSHFILKYVVLFEDYLVPSHLISIELLPILSGKMTVLVVLRFRYSIYRSITHSSVCYAAGVKETDQTSRHTLDYGHCSSSSRFLCKLC
jgi:hypothetical protein